MKRRVLLLSSALLLGAAACGNDLGAGLDASAVDDAAAIDLAAPPPRDDLAVAVDAAIPVDLAPRVDLASAACPPPPMFHTTCDPKDPTSCPGGFCVVAYCIGGVVDPHQFDGCGDGKCGACEDAKSCPADCAPPPTFHGTKAYDDPKTITIWVHGFSNHTASDLKTTIYGNVIGAGDLADATTTYGVAVPRGTDPQFDTAPDQIVGVEYYGAVPAPWLSPQDIAEIDQYPYVGGATGLQRYSLIVGKFIKWRMAHTGATHVNLGCHSMGCLLVRYVIENDVEHLASDNKIVRWVTSAGVIAGAQLARLYNNPTTQMYADMIGLAVDDFAAMEPSNVQTYAAAYDHKLWEGNSPLLGGILIHHAGGTDPRIPQALDVQLLNLNNPQQNPNDGIMYTFDEMFKAQAPAASLKTPSGEVVAATHSFLHVGHMQTPQGEDFHALLVAGLWHRRKVFITLDGITLKKDHEFSLSTPLEQGLPPAEVVAETRVSYDPYTMPRYGTHTLVDDDELAFWSPDMFEQTQGSTLAPTQVLFEGPVFDDQTVLHLRLALTEADFFQRFGLVESAPAVSDKNLLTYESDVPLVDAVIPIAGDGATGQLRIHVVSMY